MLSQEEIDFILTNEKADTARLLLAYGKKKEHPSGDVPQINIPLCIKCIEIRRKISAKVPLWYAHPALAYPFSLPAEQCSSQATALYKQEIVKDRLSAQTPGLKPAEGKLPAIADLTGGMGVDSFFLSRIARELYYFEKDPGLCRASEYNFGRLGARNIHVCCSTVRAAGKDFAYLSDKDISLIYLDPARRDRTDVKVISLQDYEPNLLEWKEDLFKIAPYILVKVSPMADIKFHLELLPETEQIHIIAVDNECKETLFLLSGHKNDNRQQNAPAAPSIKAVNILSRQISPEAEIWPAGAAEETFSFRFEEEAAALPEYARDIEQYLYEPNKAILKAGAFKLAAVRTATKKLAPNTHLYTAGVPTDFPGKRFEVKEVRDFNKKALKQLKRDFPAAEISCRNFPLSTRQFREAAGIKEGGNVHIFAVTLTDGSRKIAVTVPVKRS